MNDTNHDEGPDDIVAPRFLEMIDAAWTEEELRSLQLNLSSRQSRQGVGRQEWLCDADGPIAEWLNDADGPLTEWLNDAEGPLAEWLRLLICKHGMRFARKGLDVQHISYMLRINTPLKTLNLCALGPGLAADALRLLSHSVPNNTALRSVDLSSNQLGSEAMQLLVQGLKQCSSLQRLCLSRNRIGDDGVRTMCASLIVNKSIELLELKCNRITCSGAKSLALSLEKRCCAIKGLDLNNNDIADDGATSMFDAIKVNKKLTWLNLSGNTTSHRKQLELLEALSQNFYLESFSFTYWGAKAMSAKKKWFLDLNKAGRRLLRQSNVPLGIWPLVLAKISNKPELIHYFLVENPPLATNAYGKK